MKKLWLAVICISFIILLSGCSAKVRSVSTYDEAYDEQMQERFNELDEILFDKYDDVSEMTRDPLYEEYSSLFTRYGPGREHLHNSEQLQNNFHATVDLDKQLIHYGDAEITYETEGDQVIIPTNDTSLQDETFIRMVDLAEIQHRDAVQNNQGVLLSAGWIPVVILIIGIIALVEPEWVWYVEGGYRNKDAQPSDTAITVVKIQAFIAFALAAFIFWLVYQAMV